MALYILMDEDGFTTQTDLEPCSDPCCWPKVIMIHTDDGEIAVKALCHDGWAEIPEE